MTEQGFVQIAPSILAADFAHLGDEVRAVEAGGADMIHVDVMDGHFVPNLTIGPLIVAALRAVTSLPLHVHLMIEQPERLIPAFVEAGADLITVHVETCPHLYGTLQQIRALGVRPAVTLNPGTPLCSLDEVLHLVDSVLVMTVNPGFGGQKLIPEALDKLRRLREHLDAHGLSVQIEVDGGINADTLAQAVEAGADVLVMGSAIFGAVEGAEAATRAFRSVLDAQKPARR